MSDHELNSEIASDGYGIESYTQIVSSELLNKIQPILDAQALSGDLRHSSKARNQLINSLISLRFDSLSLHAASLALICSSEIQEFVTLLDPGFKATRSRVQSVVSQIDLTMIDALKTNSQGIEIQTSSQNAASNLKISYSQMANAIIVLDLLLECCEFEDIVAQLFHQPITYRGLQDRANWISRQLSAHFESVIHLKYLNAKFALMRDFLQEKTGATELNSSSIDDAVIFSFWVEYSTNEKYRFKLFRTTADAWIDLYHSLLDNEGPAVLSQFDSTVDRFDAACTLRELFMQIAEDQNIFQRAIPQKEHIVIDDVLNAEPAKTNLYLTAFRLITLSPYQNKLLEYRRKKRPIDHTLSDISAENGIQAFRKALASFIQLEASLCGLVLALAPSRSIPHAVEFEMSAGEFFKSLDTTSKPLDEQLMIEADALTNKLSQQDSSSNIDVDDLQARLARVIQTGKRFKRGAFARFDQLLSTCSGDDQKDKLVDWLDQFRRIRVELIRSDQFFQTKKLDLQTQLDQDRAICDALT